jgi:hypothetical protein
MIFLFIHIINEGIDRRFVLEYPYTFLRHSHIADYVFPLLIHDLRFLSIKDLFFKFSYMQVLGKVEK